MFKIQRCSAIRLTLGNHFLLAFQIFSGENGQKIRLNIEVCIEEFSILFIARSIG